MATQRLDVRLDPERRQRLGELAEAYQAPVSDVVRRLIDDAYALIDRDRRMRAAIELGLMEIEDVPEPVEWSRQLEMTHDLGELY